MSSLNDSATITDLEKYLYKRCKNIEEKCDRYTSQLSYPKYSPFIKNIKMVITTRCVSCKNFSNICTRCCMTCICKPCLIANNAICRGCNKDIEEETERKNDNFCNLLFNIEDKI